MMIFFVKAVLFCCLILNFFSCDVKKDRFLEREIQLKKYLFEKNYQKAYQTTEVIIFELEESGKNSTKKLDFMFERAKIAYLHLKQLNKPYKTFKTLYQSNFKNRKELLKYLVEISRVVEPTEFPLYAKELLKISFNKNLFLIFFDELRKKGDFFGIENLFKEYSKIDELWFKKLKFDFLIDQKKGTEAISLYKEIDFSKINQKESDDFHIALMFLYESMGDYKNALDISSLIKSEKYSDIVQEKTDFYKVKLK
ncbi:hypothetical protein JXR93_10945 [bacterium]|nr:hypothetical protein [bacterium]